MTTDKEELERQLRFREREMRKGLFELYDRLNKLTIKFSKKLEVIWRQ